MEGAVAPLRINHASTDPRFQNHPGLSLYGIESYLAVPLVRRDGSTFGTLCTLDPEPKNLSDDLFTIFELLAQLIAYELEADEEQQERAARLRALEDVVAIASHDLRQPLTILQGRAELLVRKAQRNAPPSAIVIDAQTIMQQALRAVRLSELLLDIAQAETGTLQLDRNVIDLPTLVEQVLEEVRVLAPQHTLTFEGPSQLFVSVDERRLGQVLRNLIENAAKYTPADRGPVVVTLKNAPEPAEPVELSVVDAGGGVPENELQRIFDRHYRSRSTANIRGTGLGLFIARRIIEAHGGKIWAERAATGGLKVTLRLPRE